MQQKQQLASQSDLVKPESFSIVVCLRSGGAFYTPETIDTARLHYRSSWAPVLHAVALWLSSTGFGAGEDTDEVPLSLSRAPAIPQAPSSTTKTFEESVKDRMHLMLGKELYIVIHVTESLMFGSYESPHLPTEYKYCSKKKKTFSWWRLFVVTRSQGSTHICRVLEGWWPMGREKQYE